MRKIVKDLFRLQSQLSPIHISWIESHSTAVGAPDVNYNVNGTEGWIELKYGDENDPGEIRSTQVTWMEDRIAAGGKPILLYQYGGAFYVAGGWAAAALRADPSVQSWKNSSCAIYYGKIHPETFFYILENPEMAYGNRN